MHPDARVDAHVHGNVSGVTDRPDPTDRVGDDWIGRGCECAGNRRDGATRERVRVCAGKTSRERVRAWVCARETR